MTIDDFSIWCFLGGMTAMAVPSMLINEARIRYWRRAIFRGRIPRL